MTREPYSLPFPDRPVGTVDEAMPWDHLVVVMMENHSLDSVPDEYDTYGPCVPAVVVSPYSKPNGVTNVVHDHTSVLATIEHKWNLPALSYRDANAAT